MSPAWTVADLARTAPVHHALVVADSALRAGEPVCDAAELFTEWAGAARMRWVLAHADPLSESPIETLGRFTCIEFGLPMPVSNAWIGDRRPERRVDGLWPWHGVAHEADGAVKYQGAADVADVVTAEKEREWRIRHELGIDIVRYGWQLAYHDRPRLAERFRSALSRVDPRPEPIKWWKHDPDLGPVPAGPEDQPSPHPTSITLPAAWSLDLAASRAL